MGVVDVGRGMWGVGVVTGRGGPGWRGVPSCCAGLWEAAGGGFEGGRG
jgi:hypothetical protein